MKNTNNYSEGFSELLKSEFFNSEHSPYRFLDLVKQHYKANDDSPFPTIPELFPGKNNSWLSKELQKWKKKLRPEEDSFNPTLQNLFIFCKITGKTPNTVLMPDRVYYGPDQIEYLSFEAINSLVQYLQTIDHLEQNFTVPVLYAPESMTSAFLVIYSRSINQKESIYIRFLLSSVEQCDANGGGDESGGITSVPITTNNAMNTMGEVKITSSSTTFAELKNVYDRMRDEFKWAQSDLRTVVVDDFYSEFLSWLRSRDMRDCELTKYFPTDAVVCPESGVSALDGIRNKNQEYER